MVISGWCVRRIVIGGELDILQLGLAIMTAAYVHLHEGERLIEIFVHKQRKSIRIYSNESPCFPIPSAQSHICVSPSSLNRMTDNHPLDFRRRVPMESPVDLGGEALALSALQNDIPPTLACAVRLITIHIRPAIKVSDSFWKPNRER